MNRRKIKDAILVAYGRDPDVVNDSADLIPAVWEIIGWDHSKDLRANMHVLPRTESIMRCKRELARGTTIDGVYEPPLIILSKKKKKINEVAYKNEVEMHSTFVHPALQRDKAELEAAKKEEPAQVGLFGDLPAVQEEVKPNRGDM